jgi:methionine sulfoxide reductase heme-binding subunit
MWKDVMKRWYITVGMAGLLGMTSLAITSTAGWVRRMGYMARSSPFCWVTG